MLVYDGLEVVGLVAGCFFPFATFVQTVKVFRTQSAKDISYGWQAMNTLGHLLSLVYAVRFWLWSLIIPQMLELALMAVLVAGKVYFEQVHRRKQEMQTNPVSCP